MKRIFIVLPAFLLFGCNLTSVKGEDVLNMMLENGCPVKSFEQKRNDSYKVTCFKAEQEAE